MNKDEIIYTINKYNLDKSKFVVISGAALVLLGIEKTAHDIDICCDREYYEHLLKSYECEFERVNEFGEKAYMIDNVINFGLSFNPKQIEDVNGIKCASIEDVLELKKFLNRDKDKRIIEKLESILK